MNEFMLYAPKPYHINVWLSVLEFAYSIIHLPDWADGEANRGASFGGAVLTAITDEDNGFALDTFDWLAYDSDDDAYVFQDYVKRILDLFGQRYAEHGIVCYEHDASDAEKAKAVTSGLWLLCGALNNTYARYAPLLKEYGDKINDLMGQVKVGATASARFNDTPQNGGDFSADTYTTNITQTQSETASDQDTPVARLDEIRRLWRNVQKEWVDEIGRVTIEGDNL